jgi:hypothetical protein
MEDTRNKHRVSCTDKVFNAMRLNLAGYRAQTVVTRSMQGVFTGKALEMGYFTE